MWPSQNIWTIQMVLKNTISYQQSCLILDLLYHIYTTYFFDRKRNNLRNRNSDQVLILKEQLASVDIQNSGTLFFLFPRQEAKIWLKKCQSFCLKVIFYSFQCSWFDIVITYDHQSTLWIWRFRKASRKGDGGNFFISILFYFDLKILLFY